MVMPINTNEDRAEWNRENAVAPPPDPSSHLEPSARLSALESVCERLWPFVRYFALAGGHPDAISAVADLAILLGKCDAAGGGAGPAAEAAMKARDETLDAVAEWFRASRHWRKMLPESREAFVKDIQGLKGSGS